MRASTCSTWLCAIAALSISACDDETAVPDAGSVDAGTVDGGGVDGGGVDGGGVDGGGLDGGGADAATPDGGGADAGPAVCGDRRITSPEECDDGNTADADGCSAACLIETSATCGDATVDHGAGEECDDGDTTDGDGCSARCLIEAPAGCGDGTLDISSGEQCDDGNTAPGDGCSPSCQYETVGAFCGDSTLDAGEVCDDGNTVNGDGCNSTCNLTGTTSVFVGMQGMSASVDGVGTAARIRGAGTLATDDRYLWFAENGGAAGTPASLRRIEIATGDVLTVATLGGQGAEGIATNGTDTVWVATGSATGPSIVSVSTTAPYTVTPVTGSAPCMVAGCYMDGAPGVATFGGIRGLTWYGGLLWIVDPPAGVIRTLNPATGNVTTVAGSAYMNTIMDETGAAARFESPRYIVSDNSGVLYISETNGNCIRALNATTMVVTTFAGMPNVVGHVDGIGPAARLHRPRGITSDGTSVYFTEFNFHTVRQGVIATRDVSTVAGMPGPTGGYAEGVGSAAQFDGPWSVAFHHPSNSLFVADGGNQVIRRIR